MSPPPDAQNLPRCAQSRLPHAQTTPNGHLDPRLIWWPIRQVVRAVVFSPSLAQICRSNRVGVPSTNQEDSFNGVRGFHRRIHASKAKAGATVKLPLNQLVLVASSRKRHYEWRLQQRQFNGGPSAARSVIRAAYHATDFGEYCFQNFQNIQVAVNFLLLTVSYSFASNA